MSKRALGKGLDALIQGAGATPSSQAPVNSVALSQITPNPDQPRKSFNEASLDELAGSIRENGVIQPIIVEQRDDGYVIIAGERRFRAAQRAGLTEIPAVVAHYTAEEREIISLVENVQREDLNPIEEAAAYRSILSRTGISQDDLARQIGKNRSTIANSLRLLKLPPEMQEALRGGAMTAGHARAVLSVEDPAGRQALFARIMDDGISVREAEAEALRLSSEGVPAKRAAPAPRKDAELDGIERRLIDRFGTKVQIKGSLKKGTIEIDYYSMDDLDRILELVSDQ